MPSFKRILVIKLKQPGDVLLSAALLPALKEAWPEARVTFLVSRGAEEMLADHPKLDGLLVAGRRGANWKETLGLLRHLRRSRFDLVLELSGGDRGAFFSLVSGAGTRLAFDQPRRALWHRWGPFTRLLPRPSDRMHMVEQNLEILKPLGITPGPGRLDFYWSRELEAGVQELLKSLGLGPKGFVVMHPGAGWGFKCWTPSGYARVIEVLQTDYNLAVVLTGSGAALEQELIAAILKESRVAPLNLAGRLTLKSLGALIAKARLFFGVDSAPMHLAAAVKTPTVALFGPTGDYNWRPWGKGHLVIRKDWECLPCGQDGCEGSKVSRCLTELTPEEVLTRMKEHLGSLGGGPGA